MFCQHSAVYLCQPADLVQQQIALTVEQVSISLCEILRMNYCLNNVLLHYNNGVLYCTEI